VHLLLEVRLADLLADFLVLSLTVTALHWTECGLWWAAWEAACGGKFAAERCAETFPQAVYWTGPELAANSSSREKREKKKRKTKKKQHPRQLNAGSLTLGNIPFRPSSSTVPLTHSLRENALDNKKTKNGFAITRILLPRGPNRRKRGLSHEDQRRYSKIELKEDAIEGKGFFFFFFFFFSFFFALFP
jgi:hypothetical protein